ncbi:MAG: LptF/LptG family permease [Planctomycetes bacterium]|nr:LptF/LptG family permease [Planctomycetota bacterium]
MNTWDRYILRRLLSYYFWLSTFLFSAFSISDFLFKNAAFSGQVHLALPYYISRFPAFFAISLPLLSLSSLVLLISHLNRCRELQLASLCARSEARLLKPCLISALLFCLLWSACREIVIPALRNSVLESRARIYPDEPSVMEVLQLPAGRLIYYYSPGTPFVLEDCALITGQGTLLRLGSLRWDGRAQAWTADQEDDRLPGGVPRPEAILIRGGGAEMFSIRELLKESAEIPWPIIRERTLLLALYMLIFVATARFGIRLANRPLALFIMPIAGSGILLAALLVLKHHQ